MLTEKHEEELQEKDAIPLGEREESLHLPVEKVLTTPAVRKMALDNNVNKKSSSLVEYLCVLI